MMRKRQAFTDLCLPKDDPIPFLITVFKTITFEKTGEATPK